MARIPNMNLSDARRETVEPGGYVCRVIETNVDLQKNRLQLTLDITEGPHAGYYTRLHDRFGFWGLTGNMPMDEDKRWKFAATIQAFRDSNVDFKWDDDGENDSDALRGQYIGVVARRKHHMGMDGKEKATLHVYMMAPVGDIRAGNYKVPDDIWDEKLQASQQPAAVTDMSRGQSLEDPAVDDIPPAEWPEDFQPGFMDGEGEQF